MPFVELVASLVGPALQVWLAGAMLRRKLHRRFPLFFAYTLYSVAMTAVRLPVAKQPELFFSVYWITEIVYDTLALLGIGEVFSDVLGLRSNRNGWWRFVPSALLMLLIIASLWRATYHPFGPNFWGRLGAGAYSYEFGVLLVGAITYLLAQFRLKAFAGILKKQHNAAILKGFGIFGLLTLTVNLLRSHFGSQFEGWFRYIPPGAYAMATLTWLAAFRRPEPPVSKLQPTPELLGGLREGLDHDHETLKKIEKNLPPRRHLTGEAGHQFDAGLPASALARNQGASGRSAIRKDFAGPRRECHQT
jgi:hypothetical protein